MMVVAEASGIPVEVVYAAEDPWTLGGDIRAAGE